MQSSSSTTTASNKKSSAEEKAPATAIKQISEIIINRYTKGRGSGRRTKKDPLYNHITIARCFPFIISPFISFKDVLNNGLDYGSLLIRSEDNEDAEAEFDMLPEDVRTRVRVFGSLETTFLSLYLGEIFDELCAEENRGILNSFIEELGKISEATRSNDASDLKAQGQNYLRDNMLCDAIVPLGEKSTRGFHNCVTAQLLCPRSLRDEYHTDQISKIWFPPHNFAQHLQLIQAKTWHRRQIFLQKIGTRSFLVPFGC